jgi:uncharacterized protein (DUF2126 family)/transglutaminase-like putative cysteine protease
MAIRVALHHTTRYAYDRPVQLSPHVVRLRPAPHSRTKITAYSLRIEPREHFLNWQQDPFGNYQARLVFPKGTRELVVEVDLIAELTTINPFDFFLEESAEHYPFAYEEALQSDLAPYLACAETGPRLAQLVGRIRDDIARDGRRPVDVLVELNQLIQRSLRYDIRMEPGVFEPEETLTRGHGSCRDFAWLLVNVLRRLGLAARFVSGYSIQLVADQKPLEGPSGVSADCCDLHAWAEVFLPGAGWVGLDATSGLFCGEGHIPLACTADPTSAAPVTGSYAWNKRTDDDELDERFEVRMEVTRVEDRPRPTKSYTEEQWQAVVACGDQVERALSAGDVRLTMGGEPTFVSVDDLEGDEWNHTALGPTKHKLADTLARRLLARLAPGALLHHGQGKWYPGEPLPRWATSIYFRRDGEPVWKDPRRIADFAPGRNAGIEAAQRLMHELCRRLGVSEQFAIPSYEDTLYYLWRERSLPQNVDPFDSKLDDPLERARLRRVFAQGLSQAVGYALPLAASESAGPGPHWMSGPWFLRDERLYLLPGDSALGFRLPLESLPWCKPEDRVDPVAVDPFAPRAPLASRHILAQPRPGMLGAGSRQPPRPDAPEPFASATGIVRTALCVEPRDGALHVFMPPLPTLESYLELVANVEDALCELDLEARLEGYPPPPDPRLERLQITPDPGVIEVNIHPAHSWREVLAHTTTLYEEARACRLGTDKFMLDGRHTGTGGGNHLVLGGPTPADSPILRRPDLLRSLLAYWVNHPSLSYLFSGLFIGPTSQAPRLDEARHDALYELEVAFGAMPSNQGAPAPWLVDRLFRHLLTDVTGNTHRTEICIDKLYSPDSSAGRLGLVELRGFEMPPDARMSCAQQLLVRALVAWMWKKPYTREPLRWGTSLVDRFTLPHFVMQDFGGVIEDLRQAGFPLEQAWFEPHAEFRFPRYGNVAIDGVELSLRQALEPWHVLGEEPGQAGTVRYVDSSVERLQVLVRGLIEGRHVVACNGRRVPLHPTGALGESVAGVRFRAWQPPTALHPTIPVHAPLCFEVIDTWNERSLGGCTYHVAHPGGLSHATFPKNALEAESRRVARFQPFGHSPGKRACPREESSRELPLTLDLRRPAP